MPLHTADRQRSNLVMVYASACDDALGRGDYRLEAIHILINHHSSISLSCVQQQAQSSSASIFFHDLFGAQVHALNSFRGIEVFPGQQAHSHYITALYEPQWELLLRKGFICRCIKAFFFYPYVILVWYSWLSWLKLKGITWGYSSSLLGSDQIRFFCLSFFSVSVKVLPS